MLLTSFLDIYSSKVNSVPKIHTQAIYSTCTNGKIAVKINGQGLFKYLGSVHY